MKNDKLKYYTPLIYEAFTSIVFTILILLISTFEYRVIGIHAFNLLDLTSVIVVLAVFTSGIVTGIFTSIMCVIFSIIINTHISLNMVIDLFLSKIIFVLVLYTVYILIKDKFKKLETSMYISIIVAVIVKKVFALLWIYATRHVFVNSMLEHSLSLILQIIIYCGLVYLILDSTKKTLNQFS